MRLGWFAGRRPAPVARSRYTFRVSLRILFVEFLPRFLRVLASPEEYRKLDWSGRRLHASFVFSTCLLHRAVTVRCLLRLRSTRILDCRRRWLQVFLRIQRPWLDSGFTLTLQSTGLCAEFHGFF